MTTTGHLLDGRRIAHELKDEVSREAVLARQDGVQAGLATLSVGDVYSAEVYARRLRRLATELGIPARRVRLPEHATQRELIDHIRELNADGTVSGILVLRPLPRSIDEADVYSELDPLKDIEAVHPENAGLVALGRPRYVPSTAASVFHILDTWLSEHGEDLDEFYHRARIVVVGRSNNVGKPAVSLAYTRQAAVTSVDEWASAGNRLGTFTRHADVLVVAAGEPGLIRSEHVKHGAIVLDVGINPIRTPNGRVHLVGDVRTDEVRGRVRAVTPVPGGVGPVTDVWLMRNTVLAARAIAQDLIDQRWSGDPTWS